jgi:hypothetical protein
MSKRRAIASEGRAKSARPSLRLLAATAALAVAFLAASSAQAQKLPELEVTKTTPQSTEKAPANSIAPFIIGHEDGGVTTTIHGRSSLGSPTAALVDPSEEVALYTEPGCSGEPLASGTLNEFEGTGIQVEVSADSATTFYVRHFDPSEASEPSDCSKKGWTYWESSTVVTPPGEPPTGEPPAEQRPGSSSPPAAPHLRTLPNGRANDNSPRILGSAPGAERVRIFANSSCDGAPILSVSVGELGLGAVVHVSDNSVINFAGIAVAGGTQSSCSTPASYVEDSSPPHTRITMAPGAKTRRHKAVFRFADTGEDPLATSFQCRVNHKKWKPCHSPFKLRHLGFHRYVLRVRGTDEIGNAETKPAKRGFKVIH